MEIDPVANLSHVDQLGILGQFHLTAINPYHFKPFLSICLSKYVWKVIVVSSSIAAHFESGPPSERKGRPWEPLYMLLHFSFHHTRDNTVNVHFIHATHDFIYINNVTIQPPILKIPGSPYNLSLQVQVTSWWIFPTPLTLVLQLNSQNCT